ncbi:hypothetical protein [Pseudoruegeria sp. HB172150]|uniref:hypothetical protein n=1 Tax=Pseudoruegeria sp. HB172150 TaxID=2721164 RepID=UPI001557715A|nr:hypothetical protein [Pseudoruegeria sp. HB172150]
MSSTETRHLEAVPITEGGHHFFGYYDKCPWNASGRYHLGLKVDVYGRQPNADEAAIIGMIDTEDGNRWIELTRSYAWSWQQGTMVQWLPSDPESSIIYNARDGADFYSEILNVHTGERRRLPRPIYSVTETQALSLNFARLAYTRPDCGYAGLSRAEQPPFHPTDDGVWTMDLETGESRIVVDLERLSQIDNTPEMEIWPTWVNHLTWSPDGSKFVFLHRYYRKDPKRHFSTRFYVANADGSGLVKLHDRTYFSHYCFASNRVILGHGNDEHGKKNYILFDLEDGSETVYGDDIFQSDGHCTYSPDGEWLLTDTYPDADRMQTLILCHVATKRRIDIGRFSAPRELDGPIRCDLHPRFNRDGTKVSIDSVHSGARQMYVLDVADIVRG